MSVRSKKRRRLMRANRYAHAAWVLYGKGDGRVRRVVGLNVLGQRAVVAVVQS